MLEIKNAITETENAFDGLELTGQGWGKNLCIRVYIDRIPENLTAREQRLKNQKQINDCCLNHWVLGRIDTWNTRWNINLKELCQK